MVVGVSCHGAGFKLESGEPVAALGRQFTANHRALDDNRIQGQENLSTVTRGRRERGRESR